MSYKGSIEVISGLKPKNNGTFPIVDAKDVRVTDEKKLDTKLDEIDVAISTGVDEKIESAINQLDVSDSAESHKFVTEVSETDGKISVQREQPTASDIDGLETAINDEIAKLDVTDTAVNHQFVTEVSETDGKVSVSRAQPASTDISDFETAVNNILDSKNIVFFADID